MAIADTITSMQNHTSNAYTMIGYGTDLTGINKNLENLSTSIFNAFLEALRTPDTLFTNLPKKSGSGANITLNDTANAPMRIELGATELTQAGTPTPSSPQDIHTISGDNTISVCGINLAKSIFDTKLKIEGTGNNRTVSTSTAYCSQIIKVKPSTTYVCSGNLSSMPNNMIRIGYFDNKPIENSITTAFVYGESPYSFTTGATTNYIMLYNSNYSTDTTINNLQLELGTTATTYTPYTSQEADIDLGGTQLYNYFDNALYNSSTTRVQTNDYISLPAGTYTISYSGANQVYAIYYDNSNTKVGETNWTTGSLTFTYNTAYKYRFVFRKTGDATINATEVKNVMLNKGSTALPYQEYIEPIDYSKIGTYEDKFIRTSGKNLIPFTNQDFTLNSVHYFVQDGSLIFNGTSTSETSSKNTNFKDNFNFTLDAGTYTISHRPGIMAVYLYDYNNDASAMITLGTDATSTTFTLNATTKLYIGFYVYQKTFNNVNSEIMISKNGGDYEPYGSNEWYIKKNIGKVVLDGSEAWEQTGETAISSFVMGVGVFDTDLKGNQSAGYSNYFKCKYSNEVGAFYFNNSTPAKAVLCLENTYTLETFKTWLGTHNTIVYYVLATPTYTQITGTLAEQLENVYQKMLSQKGQTNISQINNDLSFNLSVQAIEE